MNIDTLYKADDAMLYDFHGISRSCVQKLLVCLRTVVNQVYSRLGNQDHFIYAAKRVILSDLRTKTHFIR